MIEAVGVSTWFVCGLVAAGFMFAYFQGRWPNIADEDWSSDLLVSICIGALGGPFALIVAIVMSRFGRHGWWFWGRKS